jgi:uncharacterized protein YceK
MKLSLVLSFCSCAILATGCGSLLGRIDEPMGSRSTPAFFPGAYLDAQFISSPFRKDKDWSAAKKAGLCTIGLIDMPLSVATDTVLLPFDAFHAGKNE